MTWLALVVIWLLVAMVVQVWRGVTGTTRTYDGWDAVGAVVEVGFMIWIVVTRL